MTAFDYRRYRWAIPPAGAPPVVMRAVTTTLDPESVPDLDPRSVLPGDTFTADAERAYTYVVLGMAAVDERPAWWPDGTPTDPTRA